MKTEYKQQIDELIPLAEKMADSGLLMRRERTEVRKGKHGELFNYCFWTEDFHRFMNELAFEQGLRPKL